MANGTSALQLFEPSSPPAPIEPSAPTEIEIKIGEAVAAGVATFCKALLGHLERGGLDPEIKDASASRIADLVMLMLDYEFGDDEFARKARTVGTARLRQYFTDGCHSPHHADVAINICLDELLGLVSQIVKNERVYRVAWAH